MNENIKKFAEDVLKSSGVIARKYFRANHNAELKMDGSLVTKADTEIETHIRKMIKKVFPESSIMGEEFGYDKTSKTKSDKYCWVIDPIDGTSSFVAGRPIFGIMLGLLMNGKPVFGAVYQPITDELWLGYKGKTTLNDKPVKVRKKLKGEKLVIATTSPELLDDKGIDEWVKLRKKAKNVIYGGDCYNYMLLASGYIDVVYEQGLKPHDYLPLIPILEGAGAKIKLQVKRDRTATILVTSK